MATPISFRPQRLNVPMGYGSGQFGQNRSYMDYLQRLANRMEAERILEEETMAQQAPVENFDPRSYFQTPEMPYLSGLSPMARFRDMALRQQGRQAQAGAAVQEQADNQGLIEDAAMGVTRQPDGRVTTEAGAVITPPAGYPAQQSLTSPYGTGSSTRVPSSGGTFSFTDSSGERVSAPFSALRNPKYLDYMRQEEAANRARGSQPAARKERSFEDLMAQLDSVR